MVVDNESIDRYLDGYNIKRISSYSSYNAPMQFRCETDGYIQIIQFHLLKGKLERVRSEARACPGCFTAQRTIKVDEALSKKNICRLETIPSSLDFKTHLQCLQCNYEWLARLEPIINKKVGCPNCAGNAKHNNQTIDQRLIDRTIKRDGEYLGYNHPMAFRCETCTYKWTAIPSNIIGQEQDCPRCSNRLPLTNEYIDDLLKNRPTKRLGEYRNIHFAIKWQCKNEQCSHIWMASPSSIIHSETDCPLCNSSGKNEILLYDLLKLHGLSFEKEYNIQRVNNTAKAKYRLDFYAPQIKVAIEYNGKQHYTPSTWGKLTSLEANETLIKQQQRDEYVDVFCKNNGIYIIWIDGRLYHGQKLVRFVEDVILPLLRKKDNANSICA